MLVALACALPEPSATFGEAVLLASGGCGARLCWREPDTDARFFRLVLTLPAERSLV